MPTNSLTAESELLLPLIGWLGSRGWIGSRSLLVDELYWSGRRVDLAVLTSTNRTLAFELKLSGTRRAIEQAAYNRLAFDRSFVVTCAQPTEASISLARSAEVGIILVERRGMRIIENVPSSVVEWRLKQKLVRVIREASDVREEVLSFS